MIVDTSAIGAVLLAEPRWDKLRSAIARSDCVLPAPVLLEIQLATAKRGEIVSHAAKALLDKLILARAVVAPFEQRHAEIAEDARDRYGKGNGRGGLLNFGDLMVYAIAKQRSEPVLCTGRDFSSTDLDIDPASRLDP